MLQFFIHLDRRWIFLLVFLSVSIPLLMGVQFPEKPSPMVKTVFDVVDELPEGSVILLSFDYDPPSKGELQPMAASFTRHCATRGHKLVFMTLWPQGPPMVQYNTDIIASEFPKYEYGRDYVNLGFRPGSEGVIKVIVNDLRKLYANDINGKSLDQMELTKNLKNIQDVALLINVSAGTPGNQEWVQYAATPYSIKMVTGTTGVAAPSLYPYFPRQLAGILGAIKAAAEYEDLIFKKYPEIEKNPRAHEGFRLMGPQLIAHVLIMALIVAGNIVYFLERRGARA